MPIIVDNGQGDGRRKTRARRYREVTEMETFTLLNGRRLQNTVGKSTLFLRLDDTKTKVITDPDRQPHPSRTVTSPKFILVYIWTFHHPNSSQPSTPIRIPITLSNARSMTPALTKTSSSLFYPLPLHTAKVFSCIDTPSLSSCSASRYTSYTFPADNTLTIYTNTISRLQRNCTQDSQGEMDEDAPYSEDEADEPMKTHGWGPLSHSTSTLIDTVNPPDVPRLADKSTGKFHSNRVPASLFVNVCAFVHF